MSIRNALPTPNRFSTTAVKEVNVEESIAWKGHLVGKLFPPLKSAFNAIKTAIELYNYPDGERALQKQPIIIYNSPLVFTQWDHVGEANNIEPVTT